MKVLSTLIMTFATGLACAAPEHPAVQLARMEAPVFAGELPLHDGEPLRASDTVTERWALLNGQRIVAMSRVQL